ncbi:NADH:ubiquinone oxidoreductase intermediate-associated protein 30, partial [Phakopsora pachyrhizi]
ILFGSSQRPWKVEEWEEVSDSVRGGKSYASMVLIEPFNQISGVRFVGDLDSETLGGAGFASRVYRLNPKDSIGIDDRFDSFFLETRPIEDKASVVNRFTLLVKGDGSTDQEEKHMAEHQSPMSSVVYEFDFEVPTSLIDSNQDFIRVNIPFDSLKPTYRGRPRPGSKQFDPNKLNELSIMCRSFFNQQSGIFDLQILRIGLCHSEESCRATKKVVVAQKKLL